MINWHFMRIQRAILMAAAGCLALGLGWPRPASTAPRMPSSDSEVLERLPARAGDPAQRELRSLRAARDAAPTSPGPAIALARYHFGLAQDDGDPRHIGYAEAALRGVREGGATQAELLVVRAQLAQYQHDFARALALLQSALTLAPDDPEALAWETAIHMVRADYASARRACEQLARVASELLGAGCRAQVDAATGALRPSYARLARALAAHAGARASLRQWVSVLLAEMAQRLGDARAAEAHYRYALSAASADQYLLAGYAEFLVDQGRAAEAAALLRGRERSDTLLLLMARAARSLGDAQAPRLTEMLRARYAEAALRGSRLHAQDEARFRLEFLGDAAGALALAQLNWADGQREAADARIFLEAALAAKSPQAARPVFEWLDASRFEDVRWRETADRLMALKP